MMSYIACVRDLTLAGTALTVSRWVSRVCVCARARGCVCVCACVCACVCVTVHAPR